MGLIVDAIDPEYTLGNLEAKKREIRRLLKADGVYSLNRELPPPWDYQSVLVIAPQGAAGLGDFRAEADRLEAGGVCGFVYAFSRFQGEGAAAEVRSTLLRALDDWRKREIALPDAVVIIRGGGAVNDLAWLNDYELARAVCELDIPVLTGIGHERDDTILDEVANQRFDTPSKAIHGIEQLIHQRARAAAAFHASVVQIARDLLHRVRQAADLADTTVRSAAHRQVATALERVHDRQSDVRMGALRTVRTAATASRDAHAILEQHARRHLSQAQMRLPALVSDIRTGAKGAVLAGGRLVSTGLQAAVEHIGAARSRAREATHRSRADVALHAQRLIAIGQANADALMREIAGQGPDRTLGRGFTMVVANDRAVTRAADVEPGQALQIHFQDGRVSVQSQDKENGK
jgi:exodeoxyribonuclease VII large subunit